MRIIEKRAYARAGFIGNPSDGYQGKTISFTFVDYDATVVMYPWDQLEILLSEQDKSRFGTLDELVEDVELNGYYGGVRLVKGAIKRFADYCRWKDIKLANQPFSIRYHTNIPRGVGLSGSSAIVVATLRCLMEFYRVRIPLPVLASLARAVENDELGIACGYQDRVVQVYQGLVYMDFSSMPLIDGYPCGTYERLATDRLPPVYLAFDQAVAKVSHSVHGPLRTRVADRKELAETIAEIAGLVPVARRAIEEGDHRELHRLLDRNFDLRCQLYKIPDPYLELIDAARSVGASAKFAGSGGSIVGTFDDDAMFAKLQHALLKVRPTCRVIRPRIGPLEPVDAAQPA